MPGRSCVRLLALALLIFPAATLLSQERQERSGFDRGDAANLGAATNRSASARGQYPLDPHFPLPVFPLPSPTPGIPRTLPIPPGTSRQIIGFPQVARAAGLIFSGTVPSIVRQPATGGRSVETVAIRFHVDSAIRGTVPGADVTISQWIGTWANEQRYRVGERLLLFLYPPSKLGLTSCVGGPLGRFSVDPMRRVTLSPQHLLAFRADPILGGKSRVTLGDFTLAVRQAQEK
jgi:hypothetical protein